MCVCFVACWCCIIERGNWSQRGQKRQLENSLGFQAKKEGNKKKERQNTNTLHFRYHISHHGKDDALAA